MIRDDADVAIFDVLLLRRRIRQLRLERRVVDHDVDTERAEVITRIDTTHVKEPFAEFVVAFEQVPRVGVHDERTHHFAVVLDVELVDEVVNVCQRVARGVGEIGSTLNDVVSFPFVVNVEIGFDHCERAVVHAITELEFGILEQLSAEKLGVGGDTVHQLKIFTIFLIQDGETFGRSAVILNIAGYFANLAIVEDDAFSELGDLIFLNRQFSRPTDCRFAVGVADIQDDVRVFVTLDGFDFVLNRAFVREKGRQGFGEIGCANTRPNRKKICRIPILGNEHCHDICLLLSGFCHDDHVRRERRFLDATRIQNYADTRTRIDEHVARNGERDTVRSTIDRRANERQIRSDDANIRRDEGVVERESRGEFDFSSDRRAFRQFSNCENSGGGGLGEDEHLGRDARRGMFGRENDVVKSRFGGGVHFCGQQVFVDVTMRDERERGETFLFGI